MTRLALIVASLWLCVSPAAAEKAILFSPVGHSDLAESLGPTAIEALEQGLVAAGWQVLSPSDAGARLDQLGVSRCSGDLCVPDMLEALQADTAIGVAIWARHGQTAPYEVALTMMPRIPPSVNATALVHDGDVAGAAREALRLALIRWSRRHVVTLRVEGEPAGAAVTVDGRPAGRLPYEAHLTAGSHDVSISQRGHVTQRREIEIPEEGEAVVVRVELAMDPADSARAVTPEARVGRPHHAVRPRRHHPLLGPSLLAAGGAAAVAWGAWASSRGGCLERNPAGECTRQRQFSGGEKTAHVLGLVAGGLAIVGAVLWFSLGGEVESGDVEVGIGPGEARLRLHF